MTALHRASLVAITLLACHPKYGPPGRKLAPAGGKSLEATDDGAGSLAKLSISYRRGEEDDVPDEPPARRDEDSDPDGIGGNPYGGKSYASWRPPSYSTPPSRVPHYSVSANLSGAIEGTITWTGATPVKVATACGSIENLGFRIDPSNKGLGGAIVYIEKVGGTGRIGPGSLARPASVGGAVYKRGCAIVPVAQIAAPPPIRLSVHADSKAQLKIIPPTEAKPAETIDLQDAGHRQVSLQDGITRVEGDGLMPAWVIVADTPYYAITDDRGRFRIDELATGTYDVTIWHAPMINADRSFGAPIVLHRSVSVANARASRLDATLR